MQPERKKKVEFTISRNKQVDNGAEIMEQNHQIMGQKCMKPNHHRKLPGHGVLCVLSGDIVHVVVFYTLMIQVMVFYLETLFMA
ncbi:hypothetical protein HanHA300_Chr13g0492831 [Helianthus annuus]|nr:hypothetical protein HanHA300_Chr13g0492831 [Helianthus annuus]KAJ0498642.1 hypothetical protein HanHA89_Chr13g0524961 [Helianthus annuus]